MSSHPSKPVHLIPSDGTLKQQNYTVILMGEEGIFLILHKEILTLLKYLIFKYLITCILAQKQVGELSDAILTLKLNIIYQSLSYHTFFTKTTAPHSFRFIKFLNSRTGHKTEIQTHTFFFFNLDIIGQICPFHF